MDDRDVMSGVIEGNNCTFYRDGYGVTLMPSKLPVCEQRTTVIPENGYLYATSFRGKNVAFFTGDEPISIVADFRVTIPIFVETYQPIQGIDLHSFYRIEFSGGSLDMLRRHQFSIPKLPKKEDGTVSINCTREKAEYEITIGGTKCTLTIGIATKASGNDRSWSFHTVSYLSLTFKEPQPLDKIWMHYQHVNRLISVMTNRTDNHYDEISIYTLPVGHEHFHSSKAVVSIRDNDDGHIRKYPGMAFEDLGESVAKLLELFYNSKEKKPSYSLGFIPKNDSEHWRVTDDVVRAVAAAVECEVSCYKEVGAPQQEALSGLCDEVKKLVKAHRELNQSSPVLTDNTYSLIFGSIDHWSLTAAEKIIWLYHRFSDAMDDPQHRSCLSEQDIRGFVKYRNSITHGTYKEIDPDVVRTTVALEKLAICSLLERVGVAHEKIVELSRMKIGR